MPWKLNRTNQCEKCPWRTDADPNQIPNGYSREKHCNLDKTIAKADVVEQVVALYSQPTHIMACHEDHSSHCIGWLVNQVGPGNNIRVRMMVMDCDNFDQVVLHGEQHETFEETIP